MSAGPANEKSTLPGGPMVAQAPPKSPVHAADAQSPLLALLKVETEARDAGSESELLYLVANETRKLTRARQIFVLRPSLSNALEVRSVSSLAVVERNAPLVILIERLVATAAKSKPLELPQVLDLETFATDATAAAYPFRALMWLPLKHKNSSFLGGIVLSREDPWLDSDLVVAKRLASAYAHALAALLGTTWKFNRRFLVLSRWHALAAVALLTALLFIQVPLSALAPAEIVAQDPFVVAAPIDGVIETIEVEANKPVKSGDVLVKLVDTVLRNRLSVADREVQIAEARLKQSNQAAFDDAKGMHDLGIARAELDLKIAERDYARDLLAKAEVRAPRDGIAIYSDKRELIGKPVSVGERILEVADDRLIEARIDLPVADAIALTPGMRAKLFLDSDPLRPWHATVVRSDYKAKVGDNDVVAFRVTVRLLPEDGRVPPRLGVRGTAQISGDDVSLGLYIFRRPITALRQWSGF